MGKTALIVVDVQNDFVYGNLGTQEARDAIPKIVSVVDSAFDLNYDVFYTRDTHDGGYLQTQEGRNLPVKHCIYDSWGWRVVDGVDSMGDYIKHLNKGQFGYNYWEREHLEQYSQILMVGFCTDICVIANALTIKTLYPEVPIRVIANACAGTTPEKHLAALEVLRSCQVEVVMY